MFVWIKMVIYGTFGINLLCKFVYFIELKTEAEGRLYYWVGFKVNPKFFRTRCRMTTSLYGYIAGL